MHHFIITAFNGFGASLPVDLGLQHRVQDSFLRPLLERLLDGLRVLKDLVDLLESTVLGRFSKCCHDVSEKGTLTLVSGKKK